MRRSVGIMGVRVLDQTFESVVEDLSAATRGALGATAFFVNAATLNLACADAGFRAVLNKASFVFGDGTGVRWAARQRRVRLQANNNGTDIVPALIEANPGIRVFLLGGTQERADFAAVQFPKLFPNAQLAGQHHGYFDHHSCEEVIDLINAAKPDLLLVGFGNPLQERWLAEHSERLAVPLSLAVGGLFAYWSNELDRAPKMFRRLGMEWVHILLRQPHKSKRYLLGNPAFMLRSLMWKRLDLGLFAATT